MAIAQRAVQKTAPRAGAALAAMGRIRIRLIHTHLTPLRRVAAGASVAVAGQAAQGRAGLDQVRP